MPAPGMIEHPSRRRIWARRAAVALLSIGVGAVAFWPLHAPLSRWLESALNRDAVPATAPPVTVQPVAPTIAPPPKPSLAGTDSSLADEPNPLILTGTQVGRTPADSRAFLGTHAEQPQTYATGAVLANGARIAVIAHDHVVLERAGQRVELHIGGALRQFGASVAASELAQVGAMPARAVPPPSTDSLSHVLRVMPEYRDGLLHGFVAAAGAQRARFEAWGLKDGDVITAIDGVLPADAEQAAFMLSAMDEGAAPRVSVLRGGQRLQLVLDPAAAAAAVQPPALPPPMT